MPPLRYPIPYLLGLSLLFGAANLHAEQSPPPTDGQTDTPAAPSERAPLSERSELEALALERQLAASEQQQLEADGSHFLALWLPANVAEAKGLVILLPGDDESADAPQGVGPLRRKLPDAGWHSLSLTLPDPQGEITPARTAENATADAPASETPATDAAAAEPPPSVPTLAPEAARAAHVERVFARLDAGIAFAQQQQASHIVLLGTGSGAYWAARYLAERPPATAPGLLLVATRQPVGFGPAVDELLPQIKVSIGDFYYKDRPADRAAALKRKQVSQRQKQPAFVQVGLDALPGNPAIAEEQLFRRLRGWLDKHGEGGKD
ncbi:alpha/beta hydrolase family protein [Phytopseudomonas dryadis]|uniref:DUF3530 domain-containing protein n=1 Tax=Phytopseudomonas dryadis TaxID=2487520 RepID=A0A4Q9QWV3_9GAMM|nr:alpha/beta hydrolase family protein [Pseudomonas dryadis]TBU88668.1 DUF3530 domain-containing protein [Pseudomonas dryadis]